MKMKIDMGKNTLKLTPVLYSLVNLHTNEFYFSMNGLQGDYSISAICIKQ